MKWIWRKINFFCFLPLKILWLKIRNRQLYKMESQLEFKHFLSVAAIAKNEGCNFREWIEYHRLVGVEKFYIYDNESTDDTRETLRPYIESGLVEYTYFPGKKKQNPAYIDCFNKHKLDTKWIALIDLDEFLVPLDCETIPDFLKRLPLAATQLCIGWLVYGDSGHEKKQDGLVIEAFKYHWGEADFCGKVIINPRDIAMLNAHRSIMINGETVNEDGNVIKPSQWIKGRRLKGKFTISKIRINHYQIKSWEEYSKKYARGAAGSGNYKKFTRKTFDKLNINKALDNTMDKYVERLKDILTIQKAAKNG